MDFSIINVIDGNTSFNYYFSIVFWIGFYSFFLGLVLRILNRS